MDFFGVHCKSVDKSPRNDMRWAPGDETASYVTKCMRNGILEQTPRLKRNVGWNYIWLEVDLTHFCWHFNNNRNTSCTINQTPLDFFIVFVDLFKTTQWIQVSKLGSPSQMWLANLLRLRVFIHIYFTGCSCIRIFMQAVVQMCSLRFNPEQCNITCTGVYHLIYLLDCHMSTTTSYSNHEPLLTLS